MVPHGTTVGIYMHRRSVGENGLAGGRGYLGDGGIWGTGVAGGRGQPNILGVSLRFKQNYNFKLLNSQSPLNFRVVC